MGEAKRRKKLMGEDYGKKRQTIISGTDELSDHLERLGDAWYEQIEKVLGEPPDFEMSLQQFCSGKNLCQEWLREYLGQYSLEIKEELALEFLTILNQFVVEKLEDLEKVNKPDKLDQLMVNLIGFSINLMLHYSCFKEFLGRETQKQYQEVIRTIYDLVLKETLEDQEEQEKLTEEQGVNIVNLTKIIKYLVQECLKPSENFPENPQGTPKEIPQKNQNETIFYQ